MWVAYDHKNVHHNNILKLTSHFPSSSNAGARGLLLSLQYTFSSKVAGDVALYEIQPNE